MDAFFASPEAHICRSLREACSGRGTEMVRSMFSADPVLEFAGSCARGLSSTPRRLESRFLYDAEGSALFESITRQPEYYLTRTETSILAAHACDIRAITGPVRILELGSGNAAKTGHLLDAWLKHGKPFCYFPVDVCASALGDARRSLAERYPSVRVVPINCEYREAFPLLAQLTPLMVTFLGSSIGNFTPQEMESFLTTLAAAMHPGDFFLLGIDLVKARPLIEAAYNDEAGVTAKFTRNLFARMNRELAAGLDLDGIEHVAHYHVAREQVEIFARFTKEQSFQLAPDAPGITLSEGETVRTEICRKFSLERVVPELERCGFSTEGIFSDERRWFALLLLRRRTSYSGAGRGRA